jgi:hypothetical protein
MNRNCSAAIILLVELLNKTPVVCRSLNNYDYDSVAMSETMSDLGQLI